MPVSQHVVLVIDENHSYSEVIANMPWLVGEGNANGYATNYKSDNCGSLLDYLWLASGSCVTPLCSESCCQRRCSRRAALRRNRRRRRRPLLIRHHLRHRRRLRTSAANWRRG